MHLSAELTIENELNLMANKDNKSMSNPQILQTIIQKEFSLTVPVQLGVLAPGPLGKLQTLQWFLHMPQLQGAEEEWGELLLQKKKRKREQWT